MLLLFSNCIAHYRTEPRDYEHPKHDIIRKFYKENHKKQTLEFVVQKEKEFLPPRRIKMSMWQAIELLEQVIDESDPDLKHLSQIYHFYQTAESIRKDDHPRWLILAGFIHDLGKLLAYFGQPQWAVVGDTFPVGCAFSSKIILHRYFENNPDYNNNIYNSQFGIYQPHCGLDNVHMSWGHDEYLYWVIKDYLPEEASYIIRYHSFYAQHQHHAYDHLLNEYDKNMFKWVKVFNKYDLYSKSYDLPNIDALKSYYQELVTEFFPEEIWW